MSNRGFGEVWVVWGCDTAGEDGWVACLDSTPEGYRLYEKIGFRVVTITDWSTREYEYGQRIMLREKKGRVRICSKIWVKREETVSGSRCWTPSVESCPLGRFTLNNCNAHATCKLN